MKLHEFLDRQYTHEVVNNKGVVKGKYRNVRAADLAANKYNSKYGESIYLVKPIQYK